MVVPNRGSSLTQQGELPHILVVDDDPSNREMLNIILRENYRITLVGSGEAALEILQRQTFDTVLLDIMMPHMNGIDVLRVIRRMPEISDLPVILISARNDSSDIVRGLREGANDYLTKPSDVSVVSARVHTQVMLKRLMDEHKRAIAELKEAQQMRDQLFRVASHDLKAPLSNIRMAEYLLRDLVGDNVEGNQTLDSLVATVENMQGVIEKFLDVAAFQSGKVELNIKCVPIEDTVLNVVMEYNVAAANKDIHLEIGSTSGKVNADANRLQQILGNLVSNGIKYSPKGSAITIWSEPVGEYVRINVSDQGPGIPLEERDMLFKEFGKLSTRPTGQESSTGLGLWIAKHLTTLQNGDIGVDCPADGGSIFWLTLPMCQS